MHLRNYADLRELLVVMLAISLVVLQYINPGTALYVLPFSCYLAIACGVIAHNHNHCATFTSKRANNWFGHVLTIFYGYPTMMWIPTHNLNHHHFVNRPGDATITWRYTNRHNFWIASTYFFVSSYFQSSPIQQYIRHAKLNNRRLYHRIIFQYAFWIFAAFSMLFVAWYLHGATTGGGFYVWFIALVVPAACSVSTIMFFNYIQHVHSDAWSEHDHSRNFTGRAFNFLFFNNGFHTAHHERPGLHWSMLRAAHAEVAGQIDSRLNERSLPRFLVRQYLLAPLFPRMGTQQLGTHPSHGTAEETPHEARPDELQAAQS